MKEKIHELLMQRYANYGLSKELLNLYSVTLSAGLGENPTDDAIENAISSVEPIFKATQSFGDKREGDGRKAAAKKSEGVDPEPNPNPGNNNSQPNDALSAFMAKYEKDNEELRKKLDQLEGERQADLYQRNVKKISKELGLSGSMFEFASAKLSANMDEEAIRASLGESKKAFIKMGALREDHSGSLETNEAAKRKEAEDWVAAHEFKSE